MSDESEGISLTPEEIDAIEQALSKGYPLPQEKEGLFLFMKKILKAKGEDLSKVSNITEDEQFALYFKRRAALYAERLGLYEVGELINNQADSFLSLANSKKGFLLKTAITQKKEIATHSKSPQKKGFFSKSKEEEE